MSRAGPAPGHAHACDQTCESCLTMFGTILREGTYQHCLLPTSTFLLFICAKIEIFVFSADIQITHWWRGDCPYRTTSHIAYMSGCIVTVWPGSRGLAGCSTSDWADELMIETIRNRELLCRLCGGGG